jgi:hypothetical protein|tara:strand:- start:6617 stop:6793 length:177 start_codon:yes stop_codon:yes gene_type:complete
MGDNITDEALTATQTEVSPPVIFGVNTTLTSAPLVPSSSFLARPFETQANFRAARRGR